MHAMGREKPIRRICISGFYALGRVVMKKVKMLTNANIPAGGMAEGWGRGSALQCLQLLVFSQDFTLGCLKK